MTELVAHPNQYLIRCIHDKEHPYVQISRDFIRNPKLSHRFRWLLSYLLSFDKNFKFYFPWIMKEQGISKDLFYKLINEGIEQGYILRESFLESGRKRYRYHYSESPRFKKSLLFPVLQDTEIQDPVKQDSKEEQSSSSEEEKKEQSKEKVSPSAPSAEASDLAEFFYQKIKEKKPYFKMPKLESWAKEFDRILKIPGRSTQKLKELICFVVGDIKRLKFCMSPQSLGKNFDRIDINLDSSKEEKIIQTNRSLVSYVKTKFTEDFKTLITRGDYAVRTDMPGKDLSLTMDPEAFKHALRDLFRGE